MNDDLANLLLVDLEAVRQKQLIDGAIGAVYQLELISKIALFIAITQPPKNDILPLLEALSNQMLPMSVADFNQHGVVDVTIGDLEKKRVIVMQMVESFLKFNLPVGGV